MLADSNAEFTKVRMCIAYVKISYVDEIYGILRLINAVKTIKSQLHVACFILRNWV